MTRILVVDDDRPQAEEFGVLLRHAGCEVTLAGNGRQAMELICHGVPDVVLTDLDMPEMDGLELVQAIRRDYPALPATLPDPTDPANLERIGGGGLMLIRTFMDEVEHNEIGNRITLRKRYPVPEGSAENRSLQ